MSSTSESALVPWLAEGQRLRLMRDLEDQIRYAGYSRIAGVDEVGRGALAGPVVAGAVVVDSDHVVPGVDDSKRLSPARRERLAALIRRFHPQHTVIAVSPQEIDRLNILEATRLAMRRAVAALVPAPDLVLVDAVPLPGLRCPALPVIRGDLLSYAIACASILAKVARDATMTALGAAEPAYGFAANKGYGSAAHRAALVTHGPGRHHRRSFRLRRDSGEALS